MRPACQGMEPSAIAFGSRSRATSCGISAMRLGSSNARKEPLSAAMTSRCSTRASPRTVSDEGRGQRQRGRDLRHEQETQPVGAIREDAAAELEEHERHALGQPEIAQRHRILGDLPRDPGERHVLRPVAEHVEDEAEPVEKVVPRPEGGKRPQPRGQR